MIKTFLKDIAIYGVSDLIFRFLNFFTFPIYAHLFTVEEYGVVALINVVAGVVGTFANSGINSAVQRYYLDPETSEVQRPTIVTTGIAILSANLFFLSTIAAVVVYPWKTELLNFFGIYWLFLCLGLFTNLPLQILQYAQDILRLYFAPWKFTLIGGIKNLLGFVISLVLIIYWKMQLGGFFLGHFIASLCTVPLAFWLIRKDLSWTVDAQIAKKLIKFGYPFVFAGIAYWLFSSMDQWMLGILSNSTNVGLYHIASKFALLITFINGAFGQAWSTYALKLYAEEKNYRQTYANVFHYWFFFLTLLGMGIILFSGDLIRLMTPEPYWPAAPVVVVVCIGAVLLGTTQITALGISLERKTYLLAYVCWGVSVVNFILNYLLIPPYGAFGAGCATLVSYLLLTAAYLYLTQKLHPLPLNWRGGQVCVILLVMSAILSFSFDRCLCNFWGLCLKISFCLTVILLSLITGFITINFGSKKSAKIATKLGANL